jgi:hypothetical protein
MIVINNSIFNNRGQIQGIYKCHKGDDFSREFKVDIGKPMVI